jgi:hypothetical protein
MPSSKLAIGDEQINVVAAYEVLSHKNYCSHQQTWLIVSSLLSFFVKSVLIKS